jgi:gamma-glutamylcyclotransferase (GGCT)/AIG2-like uncharacterized protein YtfP
MAKGALATKEVYGSMLSVFSVKDSTVTVQMTGEKKRYRQLTPARNGRDWAFDFKGMTWLLGLDFNLKIDKGGSISFVKDPTGGVPVFVYGTLRKDQGNYWNYLHNETTAIVPASTVGSLYHNGGLPYAFEIGDGRVRGELMYIKPTRLKAIMKSLDSLEGYKEGDERWNHYNRKLVTCFTENGEHVQAYVYFGNPRGRDIDEWIANRGLTKIKDGDYVRWAEDFNVRSRVSSRRR